MSADRRLTLAERDALALQAYLDGQDEERFGRRLFYVTPMSAVCAAMREAERQGLDWSDARAQREAARRAA